MGHQYIDTSQIRRQKPCPEIEVSQHFIHTTGIRCFLSIHRLQCDFDCDSRARCAAAVRCHNTRVSLGRVAGWSGNRTSTPVTVLAQDRSAVRCSRSHAEPHR